jgi:hypothetical protein
LQARVLIGWPWMLVSLARSRGGWWRDLAELGRCQSTPAATGGNWGELDGSELEEGGAREGLTTGRADVHEMIRSHRSARSIAFIRQKHARNPLQTVDQCIKRKCTASLCLPHANVWLRVFLPVTRIFRRKCKSRLVRERSHNGCPPPAVPSANIVDAIRQGTVSARHRRGICILQGLPSDLLKTHPAPKSCPPTLPTQPMSQSLLHRRPCQSHSMHIGPELPVCQYDAQQRLTNRLIFVDCAAPHWQADPPGLQRHSVVPSIRLPRRQLWGKKAGWIFGVRER